MSTPVLDRPAAPVAPPPPGHRGRVRRPLAAALVVVLAVVAGGAAAEAIASRRDAAAYPPPGRLVETGAGTRHLHCSGSGSPTVVLEAGIGESALTWAEVQPRLASWTRVCSYDRAGHGWSGPGPTGDAALSADDLAGLLAAAGEAGPYVLVATSVGAHVARALVERHGREVVGVVLLEPDDEHRAEGATAAATLPYRAVRVASRVGLLRVAGPSIVRAVGGVATPDAVAAAAPVVAGAAAMDAAVDDLAMAAQAPAPLTPGRWGALPLVVVSSADASPQARDGAERLAQLSTVGVHVVAEQTTGAVHHQRPELVVGTVLSAVARARSGAATAAALSPAP